MSPNVKVPSGQPTLGDAPEPLPLLLGNYLLFSATRLGRSAPCSQGNQVGPPRDASKLTHAPTRRSTSRRVCQIQRHVGRRRLAFPSCTVFESPRGPDRSYDPMQNLEKRIASHWALRRASEFLARGPESVGEADLPKPNLLCPFSDLICNQLRHWAWACQCDVRTDRMAHAVRSRFFVMSLASPR